MTDARARPGPRRFAQSLAWLGVAAGFGHLFLSAPRPAAEDIHRWFGIAGTVSLVLAGATWSSEARLVRIVSGVAALTVIVLASLLIATRIAHETGVVLLLGGALNVVVAFLLSWSSERSPLADADRS